MKITFVSPPPDLSGGIRVIALHAARLAELSAKLFAALFAAAGRA